MYIKYFTLLILTSFAISVVSGQDLSNRIPAHADFVAVINNKAIVEHSSIELLNETLTKLGAFDNTTEDSEFPVKSLMELDLNFDKHAYVYRTNTDSLYYVGILLPLKQNHQVKEHMFSKFEKLPTYSGYERRVSKDGKTQVAWNEETLFILTGSVHSNYFQMKEIADRYGLDVGYYSSVDTLSDIVADAAADVAEPEEITAEADTTVAEPEVFYDIAPPLAETDTSISTIVADPPELDVEDYNLASDSLYLANQAQVTKNDSISNALFSKWLAADFGNYLNPKITMIKNKAIKIDDKKTLLRLWVSDLDDMYRKNLPFDVLRMSYGINMEDLKYGYQDATLELVQDLHTLKFVGSIGLDKDIAQIFKNIYKNKMNPKFAQYIPENHLAYMSMNISTEAYLKELPGLIERWYAPLAQDYADVLTISATALEIGMDEKAIAKVMNGDHVIFLNDLQKVKKEYTAYEYDDDYNSTEVTKTKDEFIPSFLWMFTAQDQRLYKKLLQFAEKRQKIKIDNGLYELTELKNSIPVYILLKNDIVFIGSSKEQMVSILENRFKASKNANQLKKQLRSNNFNAVLHTAAIPEMVKKLEIPVIEPWQKTLRDLSTYGDVRIQANGLKQNKMVGEIAVDFPQQDKNALQYLLKHIIENIDSKKDNR
ncbi:DUF4836 family protein [Sphingobacterium sp. SRCM116780]|uniref:DUF4836 family protein n=1 Tax=Sphingobacterium sp. SRCM116780 TaxID=2907623 RepID=UPI001F28A282|nr:DUF4836 family protein [Sphingobacterium sp. SRCM116780]UIR57501.1 DUF4836 family protein [Sphingobacterium sp. SRCM116780]